MQRGLSWGWGLEPELWDISVLQIILMSVIFQLGSVTHWPRPIRAGPWCWLGHKLWQDSDLRSRDIGHWAHMSVETDGHQWPVMFALRGGHCVLCCTVSLYCTVQGLYVTLAMICDWRGEARNGSGDYSPAINITTSSTVRREAAGAASVWRITSWHHDTTGPLQCCHKM